MIPVLSVVGKSNSGKTTFLEKLIGELTARGWRVGTVKHDAHRFDIDVPGKDSWRHAQAGSRYVAISSAEKVATIKRVSGETSLDALLFAMEGELDIILTEGYKTGNKPKIEVYRGDVAPAPLCRPEELVALVTDTPQPIDVPHFGLEDARGVADLLEERFLRREGREEVALLVDGRRIPLKPFACGMFDRTIRAMVSLLEGSEAAGEISVSLRKPDTSD